MDHEDTVGSGSLEFSLGGAAGYVLGGFDWSRTPVGAIESWPRTLHTYVTTILELPTPAVVSWGSGFTQIYNDAYARILGPRHPKCLGGSYVECWPDAAPEIVAQMQRVLDHGEAVEVRDALLPLLRHGFTEEAYVSFTLSPLRDDEGRLAGVLQLVMEVTDSVLAARRAELLRQFTARGETMGGVVEVLASRPEDIPFALLFVWNDAAARLELAGATGFPDSVLDDAAAALEPLATEVVRSQRPQRIDDVATRLPRAHHGCWPEPTGSAFVAPLRRSASDDVRGAVVFGISPRLRFDHGYVALFEALARELGTTLTAERAKQVEHELARREHAAHREAELQKEHLYSLLMQAPAPICVLRGPEFVIELINPSACELWRRDHANLILKPLFDAVMELRGEGLADVLKAVRESGETQSRREVRSPVGGERGDAEVRYLNFVCAPLRDLEDEVEGVLVIGFDVTEQVLAREQLEELRKRAELASRAKDEFLAMLGHELRNPLAPIVTALEVMRMRGGEEIAREREILERQARHLMRLVDDLLDVSRITRGQVELRRERLELSDVITRAIEMASPLLEQRNHDLVVGVPEHGLAIDADPVRMAQVVANLLTNAAKYTDSGGRVEIEARRQAHGVELCVRDNGSGIAPEVLPHVFELFLQQPQSADRSRGGLGLGLTIVRNLVQMHGGTIEARSGGRGRGSEFLLRLPAAVGAMPIPTAQPGAAPASPATRSPRRVLVVDDNEDAASTLGFGLETLGHRTTVAVDGPSALRLARQDPPEIAVLDIGLPVMDGYELGKHLRQLPGLAGLALIAVTGYGQAVDRARSRAAGFDAHLVKPVDLRHLDACIRSLAERVHRSGGALDCEEEA